MKNLIMGFGVALVAAGGATFLVLQAQPKPITSTTNPTEPPQQSDAAVCTGGECPSFAKGNTVYDVADLQSIYSAPVRSVETISFDEPPLAPKREVLPQPREVK